MTTKDGALLVACDILEKEILWLVEKNGWPLEVHFLDSALHCELCNLARELNLALAAHSEEKVIVFYGCCHPLMDQILEKAGAIRTVGQNCVSMLLGETLFTSELEKGAFFLLEQWARNWDRIASSALGTTDKRIIREVFQGDRAYLLCIRTPCSGDFVAEAEAASLVVELPIRWIDVTLEHLEAALLEALNKRMPVLRCET